MDFTGIRKISEATRIPVVVYRERSRVFQNPEPGFFHSYFDDVPVALEMLNATLTEKAEPILFLEESRIYFGAFLKDGCTVILGPSTQDIPDQALLKHFREKHRLELTPLIPRISGRRLTSTLSLIYYAFSGEDFDPYRIRIANVTSSAVNWETEAETEIYSLDQSEHERDHNSQEFEQKLLQIVREGDVAAMDRFLHSQVDLDSEHIGVMAKDSLKQTEYMCLTMLVLLSRVAITGGLNAEKSYSLADVFMQKLAQCTKAEEMLALTGRAQYDFTAAVRDAKSDASKLHFVEACKNYIEINLRRPFQIAEIAPAIGVNRSYLARKFSESEGMTIQQYILKERCVHAASLLRHTDYPISLVAEYFCFSSQSHFGKAFKEYSGMTPKDYRNKFKNK